MQVNIPILSDYGMIQHQRQARIDYNANREDTKQRFCDYVIGDEVMILADQPDKLQDRAHNPYVV